MKVEKNQNPSINRMFFFGKFWQPGDREKGWRIQERAIWIYYSSKSGESGPFFYMKNPFHRSKSDFSSRILAKFRQKKKTTVGIMKIRETIVSKPLKNWPE
jgi:hypothetical protein